MLWSERAIGASALGVMLLAIGSGVFFLVTAITRAADEERAQALLRFEQRLERCGEVPGRDFVGCMQREEARDEARRRHDDVE